MKKRKERLLALLLAGIMSIALIGCGNTEEENPPSPTLANIKDDAPNSEEGLQESDNQPVEEEEEYSFNKYIQDEVPVDLNGYEFKVVDFHQDRWMPDKITSPQNQLVVDIIADVEEKFNCKIVMEAVSPDVIFEAAQPEIMGGGKYADLIGTTMWAYGKLLGGGLLRDLNNVETLDLSASYFNQNVIKTATFGNSTYSFGAGFGSHFSSNWVIFYNSRIWEELKLPNPYELVKNNEWTWDRLVEYAKLSLLDIDGDGIVNTESDRWGLTGASGDMIRAIFLATGARFYQEDSNGKMRLACTDPVSAEKINLIYKMFQTDNIIYKNENVGALETFVAGRSLFYAGGNSDDTQLKGMEDNFGILPMPKWDAGQEEYQSAVDHNAPIFAMTTTNKNTYEAGIIITALAKRYQAMDDLTLQDRDDTFWRFEEDREMVETYVLGHSAYDVINIIKNANNNFEAPSGALFAGCYNNTYSDIVSTIASMEDLLNIYLDEFFDNLSK